MSYTIGNYGELVADKARCGAYLSSMKALITPKSVVVDIGAGAGFFALAALKMGAARVFAIEPNRAIRIAPEFAKEMGFADRFSIYEELSTKVTLPEKCDLIISDLRGAFPLVPGNFDALVDARTRFLKPDGVLLPFQDAFRVALVSSEELYSWTYRTWIDPAIGETAVGRRVGANNVYNPRLIEAEEIVSNAETWATVRYGVPTTAQAFAGKVELRSKLDTVVHGLGVWFDSVTFASPTLGTFGYSNAPKRRDTVYGHQFLPLDRPLTLKAGEVLIVDISVDPSGLLWSWSLQQGAHFEQHSNFLGGDIGFLVREASLVAPPPPVV